ncbi:hypothetical protein C8R43DRAFT_1018185 [Mycena crocata]|nr:hypothetical protein C8R43DRAFT_1018185 [Mycena crocata]
MSLISATTLHHNFWGKHAPLKTRGVEHLPPSFTPRGQVNHCNHDPCPIMVRDVYIRLWNYIAKARTEEGARALRIGGQPGIGKTLFAFYALARAMGEKIPFALANNDNDFTLFNEDGVETIPYASIRAHEQKLTTNMLVFFPCLSTPPKYPFTGPGALVSGYVVHCAASEDLQSKQWVKDHDAWTWPMELWSLCEVERLTCLLEIPLGPNYYTPVELFNYLGPIARECFPCSGIKKSGLILNDLRRNPPSFDELRTCQYVLHNPSQEFTDFFCCRMDADTNSARIEPERRDSPIELYEIPTAFLRSLVFGHNSNLGPQQQEALCGVFRLLPSICGALYEVTTIERLTRPFTLSYLINGLSRTISCGLQVVDSRQEPLDFRPELVASHDAWIWLPPTGFPTVDAVVACEGGQKIILIQVAIARQHDVSPEGLARVWQVFGFKAKNWEFIFLAPSEEIGQKLAECHQIYQRSPPTSATCRRPVVSESNQQAQYAPQDKTRVHIGYAVAENIEEIALENIKRNFLFQGHDTVVDANGCVV